MLWLQRFSNYVLTHRWQTVVLTFFLTFLPIIGVAGIIIAAFITLRKSIAEGAILMLAATLPYFFSFYVSGNHEAVPLAVWAAVGVAVSSNVLTWAFAVMLRRKANFSLILQIGTLIGVLVVSVVHLIYPEVADWWANQLQSYYTQATDLLKNASESAKSISDSQIEKINITKQYATGFMVAGILLNAMLQLIVARWWQAALFFSAHSFRRELQGIRLSQLAGALFIISMALSYLGNSVILDIMPILYVLFGVAGLSLIHYLFGLMNSSHGWFWLSVLYITLIFSLPVSMVVIAFMALLDIWLDVRKRFNKV